MAGVLVVQGGPGTGKTAVALHRAAYLLYTYRRQLEKRGVLVVGPNATFLRYIGQVLPSLGETSVLLSTIGDLLSRRQRHRRRAGRGRRHQGPDRHGQGHRGRRRPRPAAVRRASPIPIVAVDRQELALTPAGRVSPAGPRSGPAGPGARTTWPAPSSPARSSAP